MLTPVILAGGVGSRLWPMSRELSPKQFIALPGDDSSLFQHTLRRLSQLNDISSTLVVCNDEHRFMAANQLHKEGVKSATVMLEPVGRNTAPAVAMAALQGLVTNPKAVLLVLPADHVIHNVEKFKAAVEEGLELAMEGKMVTFGIVPNSPETGYGYIRKGEPMAVGSASKVAEFVEKPDLKTAMEYQHSGKYLWNSGMFMFSAEVYLQELLKFAPDIAVGCRTAFAQMNLTEKVVSIPGDKFEAIRSDSIDYAVMEKTDNATVVPLDAGWNDLGAWDALWEVQSKDEAGNFSNGDTVLENTHNSYVHAESRLVTTVGLKNTIVVETADAVLVADKSDVQAVKKIVSQLDSSQREETQNHTLVHRPWGTYRSLSKTDGCQVKHIVVNPGAQLSLQLHHHRSETWTVIKGTGLITCDDREFELSVNESTFIPVGSKHRLTNPGSEPVEIIEVQVGAYLGEDDIVRFEDVYGRAA